MITFLNSMVGAASFALSLTTANSGDISFQVVEAAKPPTQIHCTIKRPCQQPAKHPDHGAEEESRPGTATMLWTEDDKVFHMATSRG